MNHCSNIPTSIFSGCDVTFVKPLSITLTAKQVAALKAKGKITITRNGEKVKVIHRA